MKELAMAIIASGSVRATNDDEWVSCSHWGLFPVRQGARGKA
jgi:hypothetical protein